MDDPKTVLARLPPCTVKHPAKIKEIRIQWDHGCSKILADAKLTQDQRIQVIMTWLAKGGIRDFVLGKLVLNFGRPLPIPATEEERKSRRQKSLVRLVYNDDLQHLRAVNGVVNNRLESVPRGTSGSLALIDKQDDREITTPGVMYAEFAQAIEERLALEYMPVKPNGDDSPFAHAAE